jgi:hypothetical protein
MQRQFCIGACALIAACGISSTANAVVVLNNGDQVNLGALLATGGDRQFIVGDKLFTVESYTSATFSSSDFSIVGFIAGGGSPLPNIGFDFIGPFGDGSPGDLGVHEMNLQYTVEVLPDFYARGYCIKDAQLTFNGSSSGDGSFARVDETIFDFDANMLLNSLAVFDIAGPPQTTRAQDSTDYSPNCYRKLEVNKDIKMFAAHINDTATASFVRQEFSQIPTPGVTGVFGLGALLMVRRRRLQA